MTEPKPTYTTQPNRQAEVSQYMRLRECLSYEQVNQLNDLLELARDRGMQYKGDWSLTIVGNGNGFPRHFDVSFHVTAAKPTTYKAE